MEPRREKAREEARMTATRRMKKESRRRRGLRREVRLASLDVMTDDVSWQVSRLA
jgi:hypothetical protein